MQAATGRLVIGVDSSTQSTKVLVVEVETGRVVARGRSAHTVSDGPGRESDPEQWERALRDALAQTGVSERAEAISIGGQQHGLVTLDAAGRPVRPAMLWNDTRSAERIPSLLDALGGPQEWARRTGSVPPASFTVTKWAWLRAHEPEHAAATAAIRLPHDYLTGRLTGEPGGRGTTDRGDASGTGWWSAQTQAYDPEILGLPAVDLDPALLPEVVAPGQPAGTVAARDGLPLRDGALVAAGTGDNMAAAVGLGLLPGTPVLSLGTSGTVYAVSTTPTADPTGTVTGFADALGDWLPLACTLNCTLAVDRIAALLGLDREAVEAGGDVVLLPYLDGERTPNLPRATGLLTGLTHDTTPGQLLQAAYDGAAQALLGALDTVAVSGSGVAEDAPLLLIGGGAKGTAWRNTVRRLSGRAVVVPEQEELVALGAAAQAAALLTGESAAEIARRWETARGTVLDPLPRDEAAVERISGVLEAAGALLEPEGDRKA
ncbi:xylulokinase [Allostreptomyces psammosilenae]|uniref:Xylulose kinase n=1 Tax=Allostreptomyces psammosilenae TaxID=1892865 RepID=A0A852ZYN7_9ACTN|nr:xylulokinase [Allostreptomyces psammosilenae]NYI06340.1 xylulokinase [Allostreptomyces psammosilenae]